MTRILIGTVLGILLNSTWSVDAQDAPSTETDTTAIQGTDVELTLRDCVEAMTDFDVVHTKLPVYAPRIYGLTDYMSRTIYLFTDFDLSLRRLTTIHELLHVKYQLSGRNSPPEAVIEIDERRIYRNLFGGAQ